MRSGFLLFFNLYDKSRPENQTKRGEIDLFRTISKVLAYVLESFSLRCLFEKNRFPGDPQKHFGNSARYPPLGTTAPCEHTEGTRRTGFVTFFVFLVFSWERHRA